MCAAPASVVQVVCVLHTKVRQSSACDRFVATFIDGPNELLASMT